LYDQRNGLPAAGVPIVEERSHQGQSVDDAGPALRLEGVTVRGELREVDLAVPCGRVVGLAGVAGAGHRAVLGVAAGVVKPDEGRVVLPDGTPLKPTIRGAISQGVAIVSGDRKRFGVMLDKPIWDNIGQVGSVGRPPQGAGP
jgi:ABC-type sugar transport system ATPase subunit